MSRVMDASVFIGNDDTTYVSTSSDYHYLTSWGDTLQIVTPRTITNSNDTGNTGEICWSADYIYVCINTNTWKRTALSTW